MNLSATETYPRKSTAQTAIRDLCCILYLILSAYFLYYIHAPYLSVSADGFRLAFYDHLGIVPLNSFHLFEGRPLLPIAWYVARLFAGGSVTGYNVFMFSCITLSSVLVYAIVRTALSGGARWALAAATLKLTWAASIEVFDNSSLAVFFIESAVLIAIWILILSAGERWNFRPLVQGGLILISAAALVVAVGTYQTVWFLLLLCPICLASAGTISWRTRRARLALLAWYGISVLYMAWCAWWAWRAWLANPPDLPGETSAVWGIAARTGLGLKLVLVDSFIVPFQRFKEHLPDGVLWVLLSGTGLFVLLFWWTGARAIALKDGADDVRLARQPFARASLILASFGLLFIVVGILPPCVPYTPYYGSRTLYFASFGFILLILTLTGAIVRKWPRGGTILTCVLLGTFATASALQLRWGGNHITTASIWYRRFVEQLVCTVPGVSEDTVVVVEGFADTPENPFIDFTWTWILRDLTDTRRTYFLAQGTPFWDASPGAGPDIVMDTDLDLARPFDSSLTDLETTKLRLPVRPMSARRKVTIPRQRVIWLRWNHEFGTLAVVKERSAVERLLPGLGSAYARRLFPKHGMVGGGADSVMVNQLAVPHFASSVPVQVRYGTNFYNARLSAVAAFSHNVLLVLLAPDGECQRVGLQDSTLTVQIPENGLANGTHLRFKLNAVTGKGELRISLEGREVQHLSLDVTPVTWVSRELSSGVHHFHFKWEGDTQKGVPHVYVNDPQFERADSANGVLSK